MKRFAPSLFFPLLVACGNALTIPEDIPITHLPANEEFTLTLVMETCSDTCATYNESSCDYSVDKREKILRIDASVGFDVSADNCISTCGAQILAHCEIEKLPAGTYTVRSKGFEALIFLE